MKTLYYVTTFLLLAFTPAPPLAASPAGDGEMTAEEYNLYHTYKEGRTDPRYAKWSEGKIMRKAAKDLKVPLKKLKAAYRKGLRCAEGIGERTHKAVMEEIERVTLKGRLHPITLKGKVSELIIDTSEGHVVAYATWKNEDQDDVQEEACIIANAIKEKGSIVSTLSLRASSAQNGKKVFTAKISRDGLERVSLRRIVDFADARFIKLFEEVWIRP